MRCTPHGFIPLLCLCTLTLTSFPGCEAIARHKRDAKLQRVASDWNTTIRASQVIPVYPTTEDLQPGDIFLVTATVNDQHKQWKSGKFLPLDNHLGRIQPSGYRDFYANSFLHPSATQPTLPHDWLLPSDGQQPKPAQDPRNALAWQKAPMAFFPSYSFETTVGGGANTAFPISGVPVGLSLLGTGTATVTVQIKDARTFGVDLISLYNDLVPSWEITNQKLLSQFKSGTNEEDKRYIRVITRVYLARELQVGISQASVESAAISAGVPKPVNLLLPKKPDANDDDDENKATVAATQPITSYTQNIAALNQIINGLAPAGEALDKALPGGSLKVVAASSGSISLKETFARPVVIGYLGFDMEILQNGRLGSPIPTLAVVRDSQPPSSSLQAIPPESQIVNQALTKLLDDGNIPKVRPLLAQPFDDLSDEQKTTFGILIGIGEADPGDPNRDQAVHAILRRYFEGK
ncbi:MAG: hypothetical protein AAF750_03615 [Planctomycetota bacterium]